MGSLVARGSSPHLSSMQNFSMGEVSRATGIKPTTIRWYETVGLLPAPVRSAGGHRAYFSSHLRRLGFIRHARELGFAMPAIRGLLDLADHPDRNCGLAHRVATTHITEIETKIRQLQALRAELTRIAEACFGGRSGECLILEVLADHAHTNCVEPSHGRP